MSFHIKCSFLFAWLPRRPLFRFCSCTFSIPKSFFIKWCWNFLSYTVRATRANMEYSTGARYSRFDHQANKNFFKNGFRRYVAVRSTFIFHYSSDETSDVGKHGVELTKNWMNFPTIHSCKIYLTELWIGRMFWVIGISCSSIQTFFSWYFSNPSPWAFLCFY